MNSALKKIAGKVLSKGAYDRLRSEYISITAIREYVRQKKRRSRVEECLNDLRKRNRQIDLGGFLQGTSMPMFLKELTFIRGGSGVLDHAFILGVACRIHAESYLEIGTYIGESVNVVSTVCKECHFITASDESPYANKGYCKALDIPDFGNRLVHADNIIPHYVMDSKTFDFSSIQAADLYFIDADHSYSGVYHDTKNVFAHKKTDSVVIWHDITNEDGYGGGVLAIKAAIGEEKYKNFYIVDNNACGIYIPPKYRKLFSMRRFCYSEEPQELWVYDTQINLKKM